MTLGADALDAAFDLTGSLRHVGRFTDALKERGGVSLDLVHAGKVRDLYDAGDGRLLMVASDRISAFDVVWPSRSPTRAGCSRP